MKVGDLIKIKTGHPYEGAIGPIVDRGLETLPPGTDRILVYKVLALGIIIKVPQRWMELINT